MAIPGEWSVPKPGTYGPKANAAYWTMEQRKQALKLHETLPVVKVASKIGCDPRTIWRWLSDHRTGRVPLEEKNG